MTVRSLISAAKWDRSIRARPLNWWDSDLLRHYLNERICGLPGLEDGSHAVLRDKLGSRSLKRGLSIGCGNAGKEMRLLESRIVQAFDLYDISAAVTASGKAYALSHGLNAIYLSKSPLDSEPEPIYDFIYWDHALHHMSDVRAVLQWCKGSLAEDGVICINDYVGPPRLQWTKHEVEAVNSLLRDMEMKYDIAIPKAAAGTLAKRLKQMLKDPSEAPQSHLIEQAVSDAFSGFRLRPLGGAMLNICGGLVMNLPDIPAGLLQDFIAADAECLRMGIYHFAFGIS